MSNANTAAAFAHRIGNEATEGSIISAADRAYIHAHCWMHVLGSALEMNGLRTEWIEVDGSYDGSLLVVSDDE